MSNPDPKQKKSSPLKNIALILFGCWFWYFVYGLVKEEFFPDKAKSSVSQSADSVSTDGGQPGGSSATKQSSTSESSDSAAPTETQETYSLPSSIRQDQWYVFSNSEDIFNPIVVRYRFGTSGAEYQQKNGSWLFQDSNGDWFKIYGVWTSSDEADKVKSLGLSPIDTRLEGYSTFYEFRRSDLERVAMCKPGDWVSLLKNAPLECTENTISISWKGINKSLASIFSADDGTERLRIADDGLRLERLDIPEISFILK
jgi:hypothetical protein